MEAFIFVEMVSVSKREVAISGFGDICVVAHAFRPRSKRIGAYSRKRVIAIYGFLTDLELAHAFFATAVRRPRNTFAACRKVL